MQALSWGMWTLGCSMWDLVSRPAIKPRPLAYTESRVLATGPLGKCRHCCFLTGPPFPCWQLFEPALWNSRKGTQAFVPRSPATGSGFISIWQADYSKSQFATVKYTTRWFFSALRIWYNHHPYQIPEHFHALKKKPITITPYPLPPLSPWQPLSVFPDLPVLFVLYRKSYPMKLLVMVRLCTPWKLINAGFSSPGSGLRVYQCTLIPETGEQKS